MLTFFKYKKKFEKLTGPLEWRTGELEQTQTGCSSIWLALKVRMGEAVEAVRIGSLAELWQSCGSILYDPDVPHGDKACLELWLLFGPMMTWDTLEGDQGEVQPSDLLGVEVQCEAIRLNYRTSWKLYVLWVASSQSPYQLDRRAELYARFQQVGFHSGNCLEILTKEKLRWKFAYEKFQVKSEI